MCWPSRKILILHGALLAGLGGIACLNSIAGFYFSTGRFLFLAGNEVAAVGFIEAYGLACLLGVSFITAAIKSYHLSWHLIAVIGHLFLFLINIKFWHLYAPLNLQFVGWIATILHFCLAALEATCFFYERRHESAGK